MLHIEKHETIRVTAQVEAEVLKADGSMILMPGETYRVKRVNSAFAYLTDEDGFGLGIELRMRRKEIDSAHFERVTVSTVQRARRYCAELDAA